MATTKTNSHLAGALSREEARVLRRSPRGRYRIAPTSDTSGSRTSRRAGGATWRSEGWTSASRPASSSSLCPSRCRSPCSWWRPTDCPVLYRGERVGRGGRLFTMLKFRTLRRGAEERLGPYLGEELVRRTRPRRRRRSARWLRGTPAGRDPAAPGTCCRGDMSFVGPRPIRPRFFEELATELPAYWQRLVVRPGLTGLRAGAARLRDLDGGEARPRPRVDRRPIRAPLPADAVRATASAGRAAARLRGVLADRARRLAAVCGIAGIVSTARRRPGALAAMSATLVHRGPDSDGWCVDGPVGLAARRLSIIDLETATSRSRTRTARVVVVQNGEIYNYSELRRELERAGHRFSTRSATPR